MNKYFLTKIVEEMANYFDHRENKGIYFDHRKK